MSIWKSENHVKNTCLSTLYFLASQFHVQIGIGTWVCRSKLWTKHANRKPF